MALKRAIESSLRFVSGLCGNLGDTLASALQHAGAELQPPPRQVCYRRFVKVKAESFRQDGPRKLRFFREASNRPRLRRIAM